MDLGLRAALKALGGHTQMAKVCHVTRQAVGQWKRVPAEHLEKIEAATNRAVTAAQMRPDLSKLFGNGSKKAPARACAPRARARKRR